MPRGGTPGRYINPTRGKSADDQTPPKCCVSIRWVTINTRDGQPSRPGILDPGPLPARSSTKITNDAVGFARKTPTKYFAGSLDWKTGRRTCVTLRKGEIVLSETGGAAGPDQNISVANGSGNDFVRAGPVASLCLPTARGIFAAPQRAMGRPSAPVELERFLRKDGKNSARNQSSGNAWR